MGISAGQRSWPFEPGDNADPLGHLVAPTIGPARRLADWVVLGVLLAATIFFALVHPS